jgi:hypothetical protein
LVGLIGVFAVGTPGLIDAQGAIGSGGACYSSGHVPQLPSKTRVFVIASLEVESSGNGARNVVTLERPSVVVTRNADRVDGALAVLPGESPVTIRARSTICAYSADAVLPAKLSGVTPDIVIP